MRVWENRRKGRGVYGARKVWLQLRREGAGVARCTVERLMGDLGIAGISAQRKKPRATVPGGAEGRPADLLERTSPRLRRTAAGSRTSPMCPRPAVSCTRRS
jgi:putative transposase